MKKNNKGFMLAEVFIVSSFVLGVLVYMFVQTNSIMRNYNRSFSYDTVQGLYITNEVKKFLGYSGYDTGDLAKACDTYQIVAIDDDYFTNMRELANVKTIILGNLNYIKENVTNDSNVSAKEKDYIKYLGKKDKCVLLLEFNDDTYASLNMWWRSYEKK